MANPASSSPRNLESGNSGNPAEAPAPAQRPTVDLTALTNRDDFLLELGEALGGQASVNPVDSIDTAVGQLASTKRGQMLVIDARASGDVRADVQRATQHAPNAVVVVFAEADSEKQIAAAVKGSSVFAVLTIPIEGAKTTAVLDAAIADAANRSAAARSTSGERPGAGSAGTVTLDSFRPTPAHAPPAQAEQPEEGSRNWAFWAGLGVAVLALAAGGAWYFTHGKAVSGPTFGSAASVTIATQPGASPVAGTALPQPAVDTSIVAGQVDDLLEKARHAMRDRRYTAPTGDNALVYYRSALASDATNGEAKDGLRRVGDVLVSRFNDAMSGAHYSDAALALATLKLAQPSDSHLGPFQLQLSTAEITKALADNNADRAAALVHQAQQSGAVPAEQLAAWHAQLSRLQQADKVQSLAALIQDRIRADELTSPAGDSAQAYLSQLRAAAPSAPATERANAALIAALFAKARQNALGGDTADEGRWLAAARANGASAADVAEFERQLASAQAKAAHAKADHLVSLIKDRLNSGALTSPAGDSAADYLRELENSHPTGAAQTAAAQARGTLAGKLVARARTEMRSQDTALATADLASATSWGASAAAVAAVQRMGASAPAAAQPPTGPDMAALAARLQRMRYVAPEYPDRALNNRISGSVTVQYTVDKKGYTRDVHVIEATPPGIFDRAATDAIARWRYRPAKYNGQPVEVPVRTRIRFELPSN